MRIDKGTLDDLLKQFAALVGVEGLSIDYSADPRSPGYAINLSDASGGGYRRPYGERRLSARRCTTDCSG